MNIHSWQTIEVKRFRTKQKSKRAVSSIGRATDS